MVRFFGQTDVGRKRDHNEDAFHCSDEESYAVLADGMGGRLFGEVAANMAVDLLRGRIAKLPRSLDVLVATHDIQARDYLITLLDADIAYVNAAIWARGRKDPRYGEMGTTLALLYLLPNWAVLAHVGDSRIYRFRAGATELLTDDHSFVNTQVKAGMITATEAVKSTQKNIITRAVGTSERLKPEFRSVPLLEGDVFLLCSDGLSDLVTTEDFSTVLAGAPSDPEGAVGRLIALANERGGKDNITAIVGVCD